MQYPLYSVTMKEAAMIGQSMYGRAEELLKWPGGFRKQNSDLNKPMMHFAFSEQR